jgi:hypothetical protein
LEDRLHGMVASLCLLAKLNLAWPFLAQEYYWFCPGKAVHTPSKQVSDVISCSLPTTVILYIYYIYIYYIHNPSTCRVVHMSIKATERDISPYQPIIIASLLSQCAASSTSQCPFATSPLRGPCLFRRPDHGVNGE